MKIHAYTFGSEAEANAFIRGIEFVNDSTIEVESVQVDESGHGFVVAVLDYDEGELEECCEEKCPNCE